MTISRFAVLAALPLLLPGAALAAAATASQQVNVRSGPATSYGVVGQLQAGQSVDVRQCEGSFCQVAFAGKTGWVSATYLTRDAFHPSAPQVAATAPGRSADLPPLTPSRSAPASTASTDLPPVAHNNPPSQVAALPPPSTMPLPQGALPPAYDGPSDNGDYADNAGGPGDSGDAGYAGTPGDAGYPGDEPHSAVHLPDGSGDVIASTGDDGVPRPKADVPNGALSGPGDDFADAGDAGPPAVDLPDDAYPPPDAGGWRRYGRFDGPRYLNGARGRVCFFTDDSFGREGFCLRPGQSVSDLGGWSHRIVAMRNPRGLPITVCSPSAYEDCQVYRDSGPLLSPRGIASITVAEPGY